ncbi:phosphocholine-specific phospholipase C [Hufsiella ginkgonis]|uniref:phospholipase C n=1 Tax=Hufsiella ginkgonis TaxID=2695274 RepID=A0A7K1Y0F2_9SPHI|nr:phospholipase C, phosphocholine-specific [Hufsiella ginkgonis]MXV16754.1 phospholipase C, phosphocholine-specific [Hufsiella ginkgonis]
MDNRREFIKKAALLSGAAGLSALLPDSIARAMAIDPAAGTTYLDAEHIVVLMQENRSFDHCYGSLKGVRGFNDPRTIRLPDGDPVWLQKNKNGDTYAPFRLNIKETRSTWLGSLPHSWTNQVDARNDGKYDRWLDAKPSGRKGLEHAPLTLGYYNREDLPFYYSLADAFTVCDQNFCSSLTGTTPNRLYLWTGTVRPEPHASAPAMVRNENVDYAKEVHWTTFPERLEELGVSWKIYQNEISLPTGLEGDEDAWLSNFTDNPIEWFTQFNVRFSETHRAYLDKLTATLPLEIAGMEAKSGTFPAGSKEAIIHASQLGKKRSMLALVNQERPKWTAANFDKLSRHHQNLHQKAFTTNRNDPAYRDLTTIGYNDAGTSRSLTVPKGDTLHQFRGDVKEGKLPTISWVVAPENFSDHPGAPWYGSWYVSEMMDILTSNPEVWKKTIFILCYDENDGYFDHVPPFVAPDPARPKTGMVSPGIDSSVEFVTLSQDRSANPGKESRDLRESPIGLGYRVPLVIASPWSRGGAVCSQVFDHTSILQFMEKFLGHKTGKKVHEPNISAWRRAVCGDLTSVFRPYNGEKIALPEFQAREPLIRQIHSAQFKQDPMGYRKLSAADASSARAGMLPAQEKGTRTSTAIPYQLYADGAAQPGKKQFSIAFSAKTEVFGARSAGSPFLVYGQQETPRNYALNPGSTLADSWDFDIAGHYHLEVYGPNGFYRMFQGTVNDPPLTISCEYQRTRMSPNKLSGNLELRFLNSGRTPVAVELTDNSYGAGTKKQTILAAGKSAQKWIPMAVNLVGSNRWYDISVRIPGAPDFEYRFAGRIETGETGISDPLMGGTV